MARWDGPPPAARRSARGANAGRARLQADAESEDALWDALGGAMEESGPAGAARARIAALWADMHGQRGQEGVLAGTAQRGAEGSVPGGRAGRAGAYGAEIEQLGRMGFSADAAEKALAEAQGDLDAALEILLAGL